MNDADLHAIERKVLGEAILDGTGERMRQLSGWESVFTEPIHVRLFTAAAQMVAESLDACDALELSKRAGVSLQDALSTTDGTTDAHLHFDEYRRAIHGEFIKRQIRLLGDHCRESDGTPEAIEAMARRLEAIGRAAEVGANGPKGVISVLEPRRFRSDREPKQREPVIWLKGIPIFSRGNLGLETGPIKSGKTAVNGAILGAVLAGNSPGDCLQFTAANPAAHAIIHFDSEQCIEDRDVMLRVAMRRAGIAEMPPHLYSYSTVGMSVSEQWRTLQALLSATKSLHNGVLLVLLDGVGDMVDNVNDPKEVNPAVARLHGLAFKYNCSIVSTLHLNPAPSGQPTKSRGHLGSQMERKVETDLRVVKSADELSTVYTACARKQPIMQADGVSFRYNCEAGMHLTASGNSVDPELYDGVRVAFEKETLLGYNDLKEKLAAALNKSQETAKRRIKDAERAGLIEKSAGLYRRREAA